MISNLSIVVKGCLLSLCIIFINCHTNHEISEQEKLEILAKSWGLAKYYNPDVGAGEINWDTALIKSIKSIRSTNSNEEFDLELKKLLELPEKYIPSDKLIGCKSDDVESLVDFQWINTSPISEENKQTLNALLTRSEIYKNKYVSDSAGARSLGYAKFYEDPMENADLSQVEFRLLGLFRYWNIIEYFFPYKNLIDEDWDEVLTSYIPKVIESKNKEAYYEVLLTLSTEINDGHANIPYHPELRSSFFGRMTVPFAGKFVQNELVINRIKSDSLSKLSNIEVGDVILSIEGQPIKEKARELGKYLPNPNEAFHNGEISRYIFNGNSDSLTLLVKRNNDSIKLEIQRYSFPEIRKYRDKKDIKSWEILNENIGYANMGELTNQNLSEFYSNIKNTEGLILDFRYYPNWEILYDFLGHFYKDVKPFVLLKSQCLEKPGSFYWHFSEADIENINVVGFDYDKPIKVLVNENTLSFGEYFVMALQMLDNVEVIGSQTAGEDGNQVGIDMPGGIRMFMSSLGIYYPNGANSQRAGVKIDDIVTENIEDIELGNQSLINYAINKLK